MKNGKSITFLLHIICAVSASDCIHPVNHQHLEVCVCGGVCVCGLHDLSRAHVIFLYAYAHGGPQFTVSSERFFVESAQNLSPEKSQGWRKA